jgi:hypothetical protein
MLCPECGHDHEGATHCPEAEGESTPPMDFIPLAEVEDAEAFQVLALRLEEAGIPWFIQSEPPIGLTPGADGPVAMIYVAENFFRRACRALEDLRTVEAGQSS